MSSALKRITLCGMLAATSILGSSCANTDVMSAEASGNPPQVQKPTTTGVIAVKTDRGEPSIEQQIVQHVSTHAFVGWDGVSGPMGRIVLMRRKSDLCALRFTEFHREDLPSGFFTNGGPSYYAEYDWYHLTAQGIEPGHRQLSEKPGWGFSFILAFTRGSPLIKCASIEPLWRYPNIVSFLEGSDAHDYGIELAPTNWREPVEIDLAHPGLRWYRYDEKRQRILIPWEQLPQPKRQ